MEWKLPGYKPIFENHVFVPTGEDEDTYQGDPDRTDTCAWRSIPRKDLLTTCFIHFSRWLHKSFLVRWRTPRHGAVWAVPRPPVYMLHGRLVGAMDTISCLFASALLAATIKVLAVVRPLGTRIGVIAVLGTLFALLLKVMAGNPTRGEVFGATAAFYAVAVVFVSSTNNNCACP